MIKFISKLIGGTKSEKDVKKMRPIVDQINKIYETLSNVSDEELAGKTEVYKNIIKEYISTQESEKDEIEQKLQTEALDAEQTTNLHNRQKALDDEIFDLVQEKLDELLPEVYAVVKEVCRRLTESRHSYTYVDHPNVWDMIPYDVQLIGAIVLHDGKIAEMQTGEGKTLVSIMPLYLNALAGRGVHLVTVNDYLARRDCEWMKPVFDFLGVKTGSLQPKMDNVLRKKTYNLDITYGTNNEFGFDYLRDNMVQESEHMVQRNHWYSIVDEVDSVLIDEARTPLIISGSVGQTGENQKFEEMKPRVQKLVNAQTQLVNGELTDVQKLMNSENKEEVYEAGVKLLKASRAQPKHKRLLKLLQDPEVAKLLKSTELDHLKDKAVKMKELDEKLYYVIEEKNHSVDISEIGRELLASGGDDADMFLLPDITEEMSMIEGDESLSKSDKAQKIDKVNSVYADRSDRVHTTGQLLKAFSLYERDVEYVVQDGRVQIVDEHTGRIMDGRRFSDGLHQAIEAKESVKVERDTQTLATITLQNYYRLYNKLGGMTGTAETEAAEFHKIYGLEVVVIPTNRPMARDDKNDVLYKTKREKFNALIDEAEKLMNEGRPILVGTASVEVSEVLSKMFSRRKIKHQLLNAKQNDKEADIVSNAGQSGAVTIATNMAGRGTDIKLDAKTKASGGLAILGSERHDSRRIDRQLRGRSGRQGDPGSSKFFISMEDNLMRLFGGERSASIMSKLNIPEGEPIEANMMTKAVERAQKKVEENNFSTRKRLIDYDDVMNLQRDVIYTRRRYALGGERLRGEIFEYIESTARDWFADFHGEESAGFEAMQNISRQTLLSVPDISADDFADMDEETFVKSVVKVANEFYTRKEEMAGSDFMKQLEKVAFLQTIDNLWRDHLRGMDDLKEGIYLRSYAQKDPLVEYKREAYELFYSLIKDINQETVQFAFKYFPQAVSKDEKRRAPQLRKTQNTGVSYDRPDEVASQGGAAPRGQEVRGQNVSSVKTIRREAPKIGRNDKVKIEYGDGRTAEGKYKKFEHDVKNGLAKIVD
jgi:preprotein translocase subunit SecA